MITTIQHAIIQFKVLNTPDTTANHSRQGELGNGELSTAEDTAAVLTRELR